MRSLVQISVATSEHFLLSFTPLYKQLMGGCDEPSLLYAPPPIMWGMPNGEALLCSLGFCRHPEWEKKPPFQAVVQIHALIRAMSVMMCLSLVFFGREAYPALLKGWRSLWRSSVLFAFMSSVWCQIAFSPDLASLREHSAPNPSAVW